MYFAVLDLHFFTPSDRENLYLALSLSLWHLLLRVGTRVETSGRLEGQFPAVDQQSSPGKLNCYWQKAGSGQLSGYSLVNLDCLQSSTQSSLLITVCVHCFGYRYSFFDDASTEPNYSAAVSNQSPSIYSSNWRHWPSLVSMQTVELVCLCLASEQLEMTWTLR